MIDDEIVRVIPPVEGADCVHLQRLFDGTCPDCGFVDQERRVELAIKDREHAERVGAPSPFTYLNGFTCKQLIAEVLRLEHAAGRDREEWRRRDMEIRRLTAERNEQAREIAKIKDALIAVVLRNP